MRIYTAIVTPSLYQDTEYYAARKWCKENFGTSDSRAAKNAGRPWYAKRHWVEKLTPSGYGYFQESSFYFKNPTDATLFALRWS
jgi:hypothetical protein